MDNKLNVQGGVLSRFAVGPDRLARFVLVVLTQAEPDSSDRDITVEMRPPTDDEPIRLNFEAPEAAVAEFPDSHSSKSNCACRLTAVGCWW